MKPERFINPELEREYSFDEIVERIPLELAVELDVFHVSELKADPGTTTALPDELCEENPKAYEILVGNTAVYDDDLEDMLEQDDILRYMMERHKTRYESTDLTKFIRVRRTLAMRFLLDEIDKYTHSAA